MRNLLGLLRPLFATLLAVGALAYETAPALSDHNGDADWALLPTKQHVVSFHHLDGQEIFLQNHNSGKYLTQSNWGKDDSTRNVVVAVDGPDYERRAGFGWVFRPADAGGDYWYLVNLTSGLYLTWDGDDSNVSDWGRSDKLNDNQKWAVRQNPDGTYMLTNKANGEALDQHDQGRNPSKNNVSVWPGQNATDGGWSWHITTAFPSLSRLRVLTVESVKAIATSTGQDGATKVLFAGIDLAIQIGMAAGTGGGSAAFKAGGMITREALKAAAKKAVKEKLESEIKSRIRDQLGISNGDLAKAGVQQYKSSGGGGTDTLDQATEVGMAVLDAMSSEYLFNKIYGNSPDDLDIRVNGASIFPNGGRDGGRKIKSQQTLTVGESVIFYHDLGVRLDLYEYDYASADDWMGGIEWKEPPSVVNESDLDSHPWVDLEYYKPQRLEDVVITNESEGSSYLVTFTIDALRPVGGQLWEQIFERNPGARGADFEKRRFESSTDFAVDTAMEATYERMRAGGESPVTTCGLTTLRPLPTQTGARAKFHNRGQRPYLIYQIDRDLNKLAPAVNGEAIRTDGSKTPLRVESGEIADIFTATGAVILLEDENGNCIGRVKIREWGNDYSYDEDASARLLAAAGASTIDSDGNRLWKFSVGQTVEVLRPADDRWAAASIVALDDFNGVNVRYQDTSELMWMNESRLRAGDGKGLPSGGGSSPAALQWNAGDVVEVLRPADNTWTPASVISTDPINGVMIVYQDTGEQMSVPESTVRATQGGGSTQPGGSSATLSPGDVVEVQNPADNTWLAASVMDIDPINGVLITIRDTGQQLWVPVNTVRAPQTSGTAPNATGLPLRVGDEVDALRPQDNIWTAASILEIDQYNGILVIYQNTGEQMWLPETDVRPSQGNGMVGGVASVDPNLLTPSATGGGTQMIDANSCGMRGQVASVFDPSQSPQDFLLVNSGPTQLYVYWVDEQGNEVNFNRDTQPVVIIAAGGTQSVQAVSGLVFSVFDDAGNCAGVLQITGAGESFSVGGGNVGVASTDPNAQPGTPNAAGGGLYHDVQAYVQAGGDSCDLRGRLGSDSNAQPQAIDVAFTNAGSGNLYVFWTDYQFREGDYQGNQQPIAAVAPGETQSIPAYVGHVLSVLDDNLICVGLMQISSDQSAFTFASASSGQTALQNGGQAGQGFSSSAGGSCGDRGAMVSDIDPQQTVLDASFTNAGQTNLYVYWIGFDGAEGDFQGGQQPVLVIPPASSQALSVQQGFRFVVLDDSYSCVGVVQAVTGASDFSFAGIAPSGPAGTADPAGSYDRPALDPGGMTQSAAPLDCGYLGQITSAADGAAARLTITNQQAGNIFLYWIDQSGNATDDAGPPVAIAPNQSQAIDTFVGSAFALTDENSNCLGLAPVAQAETAYAF